MKLRITIFIALLLAGCDSPPVRKWRIAVIRPDGVEHKYWDVDCEYRPVPYALSSGMTIPRVKDTMRVYDFERTILAPQGWLLSIEESK